jgi:hypothetical protein
MDEESERAKRCWAYSLGDCEGVLSLEHYISACLFADMEVMVRGFGWCRDKAKSVRIETLGRNMLCEKHNNALSPLDANAAIAFRTLEESARLLDVRRDLRARHWTAKQFTIDVSLLERWCVKTLINLNFKSNFKLARDPDLFGVPSKGLVDIAFGKRNFTGAGGLYIRGRAGDQVTFRRQVSIQTTTTIEDQRVVACRFDLFGYPLMLNLLHNEIALQDGSVLLHREAKMWFTTKDDRGRDVKSHLVHWK